MNGSRCSVAPGTLSTIAYQGANNTRHVHASVSRVTQPWGNRMQRRIVAYVGLVIAFSAVWPYAVEQIPLWVVLVSLIAYTLAATIFTKIMQWRLTRFARVSVLVASITTILLWLISSVAYVRLPYVPSRAVAIGSGSFIHHKGVSNAGTPLTFMAHWIPTTRLLGDWGSSELFLRKGKSSASSFISIWPLVIALVIPTALLWLFVPRQYPAGHCQNCGYNLTGNTSGVCPECGAQMERPFKNNPDSGDG